MGAIGSMISSFFGGGGKVMKVVIASFKYGNMANPYGSPLGTIVLPVVTTEDTKLSQTFSIEWTGGSSQPSAVGESSPIVLFKKYNYDEADLTLVAVVDATGVYKVDGVPGISYDPPNISLYLKMLKNLLYNYESEGHQPPILKLTWGKIFAPAITMEFVPGIFECVLESMEIEYELFSSDGNPVRAKVTLKFKPLVPPGKRPTGNSPDLTHIIKVKHGDNLPALCRDIYDSAEYYHQIARVNNLPSAYALEPGMELLFPPLDKFER